MGVGDSVKKGVWGTIYFLFRGVTSFVIVFSTSRFLEYKEEFLLQEYATKWSMHPFLLQVLAFFVVWVVVYLVFCKLRDWDRETKQWLVFAPVIYASPLLAIHCIERWSQYTQEIEIATGAFLLVCTGAILLKRDFAVIP